MSEPNTGLRSRLVDVGVELVTAEGVQALSLREIARRAGVSHGAPRRYFPTHLELLSAIARRGFEELAVRGSRRSGTVRRARVSRSRRWAACISTSRSPTGACTN